MQQDSLEHTPTAGEWGSAVHALLGQLDARHGQEPMVLDSGKLAMAQQDFSEGGQGSLDDLLEALDGGLQVRWRAGMTRVSHLTQGHM